MQKSQLFLSYSYYFFIFLKGSFFLENALEDFNLSRLSLASIKTFIKEEQQQQPCASSLSTRGSTLLISSSSAVCFTIVKVCTAHAFDKKMQILILTLAGNSLLLLRKSLHRTHPRLWWSCRWVGRLCRLGEQGGLSLSVVKKVELWEWINRKKLI